MAHKIEAGTFLLPKKLFKRTFGFGLDFGSSIIKMVYTTVEDESLRVHLVNFPRQFVQESVEFLTAICQEKLTPGAEYCMTGIGIGVNLQYYEKELDIKVNIQSEHSCWADGFLFLSRHLDWDDFVYPPNTAIRQEARQTAELLEASLKPAPGGLYPIDTSEAINYHDALADLPDDRTVHFPTYVTIAGSGHYLFEIQESGHIKLVDFFTIAGKTLLGLGNLLTGENDFDEILKLAEKGNAANLDQSLGNLGASDSDNAYHALNLSKTKLFAFGLASYTDKDKFRREDISAALVNLVTNTAAQDAFNWCCMRGIKQIFFVGGMPANSQLIRDQLESEFFQKSFSSFQKYSADCLFVRFGGHLSAINTLFQNLEFA